MELDYAAVERALAYADGDATAEDVGATSAHDVIRAHAEILGNDPDPAGLLEEAALDDRRDRIARLLAHVREREDDWLETAEGQLRRVTPDADLSSVTVHLGVGYTVGVGMPEGAYLNLAHPLFLEHPRQLLYTLVHESSHVVYHRHNGATADLGREDLATPAGRRQVFRGIYHTEALATYTPLELRRAEGALGARDHVLAADYRVLEAPERLRPLVREYDEFRERLRTGPVEPDDVLRALFDDRRLPYRVGLATLDRLERLEGLAAVREAFHATPATFLEEYDPLLEKYRSA